MSFTDWDGADGTIKPGSIKRASSSNDKVWGEENLTETKLPYGTFVAVNPDGGVMPLAAGKRIHGIVVRDIYGDGAPHNKQVNVGHFSHGDCVGFYSWRGGIHRGDGRRCRKGDDRSSRQY